MSDILTRCSKTGEAIRTGLTTEMIELDTLPKISIPIQCPACGQQHTWTPSAAWIEGDRPPLFVVRP
jgi:hypothetical protein